MCWDPRLCFRLCLPRKILCHCRRQPPKDTGVGWLGGGGGVEGRGLGGEDVREHLNKSEVFLSRPGLTSHGHCGRRLRLLGLNCWLKVDHFIYESYLKCSPSSSLPSDTLLFFPLRTICILLETLNQYEDTLAGMHARLVDTHAQSRAFCVIDVGRDLTG